MKYGLQACGRTPAHHLRRSQQALVSVMLTFSLQVPLPAEMLLQPAVVRSIMSLFNDLLFTRFRAEGDLNLFDGALS